jgi:hypothetical protein
MQGQGSDFISTDAALSRAATGFGFRQGAAGVLAAVPALTVLSKLQNYRTWIAVLRCHKALILAKNVLYKQNPMKLKNAATGALPLSGALFFAASPRGLVRRA